MPVSVMAYIGDAVYELAVRLALAARFKGKSGELHRRSVRLVRASTQAAAARMLLTDLTEEEAAVFRRARNSAPGSLAKHAAPVDYRVATGLEAVIGYLHINHRQARIDQLMDRILEEYKYGEEIKPTADDRSECGQDGTESQ